ncbi:MAG: ankyrin repeat domain-containing protein [Gallionella sp.]|nr:ankyrin repeat domain-containing protein [Gallionella sp.]
MDARLLTILNNRVQNYPHALARQFPNILSKLMELWDSPAIDDYFVELMVDNRGSRAGFPEEVASDIMYLSMVSSRQIHQGEVDLWADVPDVVRSRIEQSGLSFTPLGLIQAAEYGNRELVELFLGAGMHANVYDERKWTPLMISAFNGNLEMVALLLDNGAVVRHRDKAGYTALHWAAFNGYSKALELLLSRQADVDARSKHGWTPLLQAATRGHLSSSVILIGCGADVNTASDDGWTPLHKAAANGHLATVKMLLDKGADPGARLGDGTTPQEMALKNHHEHVVAVFSGKAC